MSNSTYQPKISVEQTNVKYNIHIHRYIKAQQKHKENIMLYIVFSFDPSMAAFREGVPFQDQKGANQERYAFNVMPISKLKFFGLDHPLCS